MELTINEIIKLVIAGVLLIIAIAIIIMLATGGADFITRFFGS